MKKLWHWSKELEELLKPLNDEELHQWFKYNSIIWPDEKKAV